MRFFFTFIIIFTFNVIFIKNVSAGNRNYNDSIILTGKIYDKTTTQELIGVTVDILKPDSSIVNSVEAGKTFERKVKSNGSISIFKDSTSQYSIKIPKIEGIYLLKFSKEGYNPYYLNYSLKFKSREICKDIHPIYLGRNKITTLADFTIKASRVMFYHKGDTIIYNADAFSLPEGSMLDALIKQMPGVEIKNNKIYVNGRFVESLLLNGKDFFKGNKKVMMDNIGAYTVKDIALYERKNELSYILGERDDVDKDYVMDVRLKKDFMTGYMINAEAGGGTKDRYVGRLFAMLYTNNSRLALYGNTNNINKSNNLSDSEFDLSNDSQDGINRRTNGGFDYRLDNSSHTWEIAGNIDVAHDNKHNNQIINSINYLQSNNTFEFQNNLLDSKNLSISTTHDIKLKKENWNLNIKPSFTYNNSHKDNNSSSASFIKEIENLNCNILQAIYSGSYNDLRKLLINRNMKDSKASAHGFDSKMNIDSRIKIPNSPDAIALKFQIGFNRESSNSKTLQEICYGMEPISSQGIQRSSLTSPDYNFYFQGMFRYFFRFPIGNFNASYEYVHSQKRKNFNTSLLEALSDSEGSIVEFAPDAIQIPDLANSYTSKLYSNEHHLKLNWTYKKKYKSGRLQVNIQPVFILESQNLYYRRGEVNANPSRTFIRFNIPEAYIGWTSQNKKYEYRLDYNLRQRAVNLVNTIDISNTIDPLNIIEGNPDLKNSTSHDIKFSFIHKPYKKFSQSVMISANWLINDFASEVRYNSETGIRIFNHVNVQGNYILQATHDLHYRFGSRNRFYTYNTLYGSFERYTNLTGYDESPRKQKVYSNGFSDELVIGFIPNDKFDLSLNAEFNFNHSQSNSQIDNNNRGYWKAGISSWADLPLNFQFKTELDFLKRFGYIDDAMNKFRTLWNAEIGYHINNGIWKISIYAHDILHQMNGVSFRVNANGRKQILNTILPSYLMLKVAYRFNFKPKKH